MFRLLKFTVLLIVLVAIGAFFLGWWGGRTRNVGEPSVIGTTGVDGTRARQAAEKAREVGSDVAQKTAVAAGEARRTLEEGGLTAKIKAKMALDDTVKALDLDVDTNGTVVTVSGLVSTEAERTKALQLAKETDGVTQVIDRIQLRR